MPHSPLSDRYEPSDVAEAASFALASRCGPLSFHAAEHLLAVLFDDEGETFEIHAAGRAGVALPGL
jgi:hypothetical protein